MKQTTKQIYDKVTSIPYKNLNNEIEKILEEKNWSLPNANEYSKEEIEEDINFIIETLEEVCKNNKIDEYSLATRNSLIQQLEAINTNLSNAKAGHLNHFHALVIAIDNMKQSIINNNLSLKRSNIPSYNQKLKEFDNLNSRLKTFLEDIKEAKENSSKLKSWVVSSSSYVKDIKDALHNIQDLIDNIDSIKDKTESLESEAKRNINNISADRQDILEIKKEIETYKQSIASASDKIDETIGKMDASIHDNVDKQAQLEIEWSKYQANTDEVISKNKTLNFQLEQQIQKATGSGLFGVFDKRKEELSKNLYAWLIVSGLALLVLLGLSYSIISDVSKEGFDKWLFFAKISGSLPLIYLIYFTSNRFTKERRLIEEYAFKSTISFALEPYSKLIEKLKDDDATKEYKEFMIDSIRDIFSTPTDKVFSKDDKLPHDNFLKSIDEVHKIFDKIKDFKTQ